MDPSFAAVFSHEFRQEGFLHFVMAREVFGDLEQEQLVFFKQCLGFFLTCEDELHRFFLVLVFHVKQVFVVRGVYGYGNRIRPHRVIPDRTVGLFRSFLDVAGYT